MTFLPASTIVVVVVVIVIVVIVSNNSIDNPHGNAGGHDTEHVKHNGADAAAQGHSMEGLGCALLFSRVTQTVSLHVWKRIQGERQSDGNTIAMTSHVSLQS